MIATDAELERMMEKVRLHQESADSVQINAHPESADLCQYNLGRGMSVPTAYRIWGRGLVDAVRRRSTEQELAEIARKQKADPVNFYKMLGLK